MFLLIAIRLFVTFKVENGGNKTEITLKFFVLMMKFGNNCFISFHEALG